jgi:tetratricopeptide (TPR) repeat protein
VLSSLGSTYANRGMYQQAVEVYEQALKLSQHSRLWTNLGIAEIGLGRPEGWKKFERAIEADPVAWEPFMARGNLYYKMKRYDEAIREYERVLQILPDHPDAHYNLRAARAMKSREPR